MWIHHRYDIIGYLTIQHLSSSKLVQTEDWISFELLVHNVEDSNLESLLKMQLFKLLADSSDLET